MPNERVLMGKLRIFGKRPGDKTLGWLYDQSKFLFKSNAPDGHAQEYDDFCRQVITASVQISQNAEGKKVADKFRNLKFMVDIVPACGGGFFVPFGSDASATYELPNRGETGAVIVWDPSGSYRHNNTADGGSTEYPPWVILAHEMGHAIQLGESGQNGNAWLSHYASNQEDVEMDNIGKHETPIVQSLGLKARTKYQ